jgi:hypothetical protein
MHPDTQAALAELVALTGDVKRALEHEVERVADIEHVARQLAEQHADDTRVHAVADRIGGIAREARAQLRDTAASFENSAFSPALHELIRRDTAG